MEESKGPDSEKDGNNEIRCYGVRCAKHRSPAMGSAGAIGTPRGCSWPLVVRDASLLVLSLGSIRAVISRDFRGLFRRISTVVLQLERNSTASHPPGTSKTPLCGDW